MASSHSLWFAVDVIYSQFPDLFILFWIIGLLVGALSTTITVFLMCEHYRTGLTKLGFMNAETNFTIKILAIQPVFVFTAVFTLFEPDMGYFAEAIQTLMLGWCVYRYIAYAVYALGGAAKFLQHATSTSKSQIWHHFPGCCVWVFFRCCCKSLNEETTPTVGQIMGPLKWMIAQFVVLPSFFIWALLAIDGSTRADREIVLKCFSSFTWLSTLIGWYGLMSFFNWIRPIEVTFDKELDKEDGLMIGGIADEKGSLLASELRISAGSGSGAPVQSSTAAVGRGSGAGKHDADVGIQGISAPASPSFVDNVQLPGAEKQEQADGSDIHGKDDNQGEDATGCCVKCTSSTQKCWNWILDGLFKEEPRTFGEQFVVRRKLMYLQVHFLQTLTLIGFLRLFMPRLVTDDNRWVEEEDMCHAWGAFIIICCSLPISLFSWFAFPVVSYAVPDEGSDSPEPMRAIASRVISGPCPADYPPEPSEVAELAMLVGTKHDANYQFHHGIGVESRPDIVSERVHILSDML